MIIAAKVTSVRNHENADSLRVYSIEAPGIEPTQVIANLENTYDVGDVVAAALVGTELADGTSIKKAKIRGVLSFGMLLGKTEREAGSDITGAFGAKSIEKVVDESQGVVEESNWPRYTSIDGFLRVRDEILACPDAIISEKIHGCFSGHAQVMLANGEERAISDIIDNPSLYTHVLTCDFASGEYRPARITGRKRVPCEDALLQVNGKGVRVKQKWLLVALENGREIICTSEHPFYSRTREAWIRAREIEEFEDIESPLS